TVCSIKFYFFFSSRRRHTRLQGDWSSDVCSSDLNAGGRRARSRRSTAAVRRVRSSASAPPNHRDATSRDFLHRRDGPRPGLRTRSEERRVGKECRSRWSRDLEQKKEAIDKRCDEA